MAEILDTHIKRIVFFREKIEEDSEKILPVINLDELLKDPKQYLFLLASEFLNQHMQEIKGGAKEGKNFALKILK